MNINIDIGQMMQMQQEQQMVMQICKEHDGCVDCPMKTQPIQTQTSIWTCEHTEVDNASKV